MSKKKEQDEEIDGPIAESNAITKYEGAGAELVKQGYSAEVIHTLKDGEQISGIFLGAGGTVDVTDPNTGEMRPIQTWRVRSRNGGVVVSLLGAAQLNARLAGLDTGTEVVIARQGTTGTAKGRRVNNYLIFTKSPATASTVTPLRDAK